MEFRIGDIVQVIDDDIEGKIIEILDSNIWIETSDGFSMKFQLKDLVKIEKETEPLLIVEKETIAEALQEKEHFRKNRKRTFSKKKEKQAPPMEVDLHIEKLVPYLKGLSNHDILTLDDTVYLHIYFGSYCLFSNIEDSISKSVA